MDAKERQGNANYTRTNSSCASHIFFLSIVSDGQEHLEIYVT